MTLCMWHEAVQRGGSAERQASERLPPHLKKCGEEVARRQVRVIVVVAYQPALKVELGRGKERQREGMCQSFVSVHQRQQGGVGVASGAVGMCVATEGGGGRTGPSVRDGGGAAYGGGGELRGRVRQRAGIAALVARAARAGLGSRS